MALGAAASRRCIARVSLLRFLGCEGEEELFDLVARKVLSLAAGVVRWGTGGIFSRYAGDGREALAEAVRCSAKEFGADVKLE